MNDIVIYGNGSAAKTTYNRLEQDSPYKIKAFTVEREFIKEQDFLGLPVIPFDQVHHRFEPEKFGMFIAVGYAKVNALRARIYRKAKDKGYSFINYISSKAVIWPCLSIGENCIIGANTVIQPSVKIGHNVIIGDNCFIGHDSVIGDHCFIAACAAIAGRVNIEELCFVGLNASVKDGIRLGRKCVIGLGVSIISDVKEDEVYISRNALKAPLRSDQLW